MQPPNSEPSRIPPLLATPSLESKPKQGSARVSLIDSGSVTPKVSDIVSYSESSHTSSGFRFWRKNRSSITSLPTKSLPTKSLPMKSKGEKGKDDSYFSQPSAEKSLPASASVKPDTHHHKRNSTRLSVSDAKCMFPKKCIIPKGRKLHAAGSVVSFTLPRNWKEKGSHADSGRLAPSVRTQIPSLGNRGTEASFSLAPTDLFGLKPDLVELAHYGTGDEFAYYLQSLSSESKIIDFIVRFRKRQHSIHDRQQKNEEVKSVSGTEERLARQGKRCILTDKKIELLSKQWGRCIADSSYRLTRDSEESDIRYLVKNSLDLNGLSDVLNAEAAFESARDRLMEDRALHDQMLRCASIPELNSIVSSRQQSLTSEPLSEQDVRGIRLRCVELLADQILEKMTKGASLPSLQQVLAEPEKAQCFLLSDNAQINDILSMNSVAIRSANSFVATELGKCKALSGVLVTSEYTQLGFPSEYLQLGQDSLKRICNTIFAAGESVHCHLSKSASKMLRNYRYHCTDIAPYVYDLSVKQNAYHEKYVDRDENTKVAERAEKTITEHEIVRKARVVKETSLSEVDCRQELISLNSDIHDITTFLLERTRPIQPSRRKEIDAIQKQLAFYRKELESYLKMHFKTV